MIESWPYGTTIFILNLFPQNIFTENIFVHNVFVPNIHVQKIFVQSKTYSFVEDKFYMQLFVKWFRHFRKPGKFFLFQI